MLKIFFDGGCRPNPGPIEIAAVMRGQAWVLTGLGDGDNHEAEWRALLHAAELARDEGARDVLLIGDSLAVIAEARGLRTSARSAAYREALQKLALSFDRMRLKQVARAHNLAGQALERLHGRL